MRAATRTAMIALVAVLALVVAGCVPAPAPDASGVTVVSVIDGDTIETSAGTVRIIGIDTPERGECGYDAATAAIAALVSEGEAVTLELPPGQNDTDTHGRLIRYVTAPDGTDLGLTQLERGMAVARYDSTDGYPAHPREEAYHAAQIATFGPDGTVVTVDCAATPAASTEGAWWEQYPSCGRLKRNDVGHPTGPFHRDDPAEADAYEWFAHTTGNNGDGDGDGLACE